MRFDWVPASAALLVTGSLALALASILTPNGDSTAETLRLVEKDDYRWLAVAAIYFLASVMLTMGLPAALTLVDHQRRYLGMASAVVLGAGFIGVAGYAMLLSFLRALVVRDALGVTSLQRAVDEPGLMVFLYGWIGMFYVGELLLAVALFLSVGVPRWVPTLLLLHVVSLAASAVLPDAFSQVTILIFAAGFVSAGIVAAAPERVPARVASH